MQYMCSPLVVVCDCPNNIGPFESELKLYLGEGILREGEQGSGVIVKTP